jgi:hypothetical protein
MTSNDGRFWMPPALLAAVEKGHYQISNRRGQRVATAFNYHPTKGGLNARTNLYYLETPGMGATWRTAGGDVVTTPLTEPQNAALVHDYEAMGKLVYLKDLNFDAAGRPVIVYLTTNGYAPGPAAGKREWFTARWTGDRWERRPFTMTDHNYDYGSLYINDDAWRIIAPTEPGPQPWTTGGEMVLWKSSNNGATWTKVKQLTIDSPVNHTYARRPVNAHPDFYAFWADGHGRKPSSSRLYFCNRDGDVFMLPTKMEEEFANPIPVLVHELVPKPGSSK